MKSLVKALLFAALLCPGLGKAQTDSIRLLCPLNHAVVVPPPKNVMQFDVPDLCIVLTSIPDTVVKACTDARVTNVVENQDEPGKWEIVLFRKYKGKEYYFWYTGVERPLVKRHEVLKEGQPIGFIQSGNRIELLMYDFETQVDPTRFLNCKEVLKRGF